MWPHWRDTRPSPWCKHDGQVEAARQLGATHVVQSSSIRKAIQETRALTPNDRGVDIAIEAVGVPDAWQEAVELVRKGGTVNFFGGCAKGTHVTLDTNRIHYSDITLRATFHHTPAICRKALALIASGRFQAGAFITGRAHLYELNRVFEKLMNRSQRNQNRNRARRSSYRLMTHYTWVPHDRGPTLTGPRPWGGDLRF